MHQFVIAILFVIAGYQTDARKLTRVPLSPCICTADYSPVCGTNGATYSNQCQLECAQKRNSGIELECQGSCPCACQCQIGAALSKKCQEKCSQTKNVCLQPKVSGPCEAHEMVWFYDLTTNRCGQFVYGGCGGNGNRFDSEQECEKTCADPKTQDPCVLPMVVGNCRASIPRWYYDIKGADCKEFNYGGCDANANNFQTRQQCLDRC